MLTDFPNSIKLSLALLFLTEDNLREIPVLSVGSSGTDLKHFVDTGVPEFIRTNFKNCRGVSEKYFKI